MQNIKYSFSTSQEWSTAMKYFLTNLQVLIYKSQLLDLEEQKKNTDLVQASQNYSVQQQ